MHYVPENDFSSIESEFVVEVQLRTKIRRIILAVFSISLINSLPVLLGFGEYFLPIAAYHIPHPIFNLFGLEVSSIWLSLMVFLIISVIPSFNPDTTFFRRIAIGTLILFGVLAYRLAVSFEDILIYTVVITMIYSVVWKKRFSHNWRKSIGSVLGYTAVAIIFGLSWKLIDTFFFLPVIIVGLTGIYLFLKWLIGRKQSHPETAGIEEDLYKSSAHLLKSPTGAATACVIYMALFSATTSVTKYETPMDFSNLLSLHPYSLALNLSGTTTMVFYVLIYVFWFKLLERAPYSVEYWENGYREEAHRHLGDRPSYLLVALPTVGWILTRFPALDVARHGKDVAGEWNLLPLAAYSIFLIIVLISTGIIWVGRGSMLFESSFISPDKSINSDKYLFAVAIVFLFIFHLYFSVFAAILILFASILLLIDGITSSNSLVPVYLALLELLVLLVFGSLFLNSTELVERFREVLLVFLFAYILLQAAKQLGVEWNRFTIG